MTMKAISLRAPWWWFIFYSSKRVENRDWYTSFRGTVLIHASSWFDAEEIVDDAQVARDIERQLGTSSRPLTLRELRAWGGAFVGLVDVIDCVREQDSPWLFGPYGFVLENPRPLIKPIRYRGGPGFFDVPDAVYADALALAA